MTSNLPQDLFSALQASNLPPRPKACPQTSNLIFRHKSSPRPQTPPQLPLRPAIFPLRTSGNSPLCPTGHRPFGAAALLSLHYFTWPLGAGHCVSLTMYDPWTTCFAYMQMCARNVNKGWNDFFFLKSEVSLLMEKFIEGPIIGFLNDFGFESP